MAAEAPATTVDPVTGSSLTAHERRVVWTHRAAWFLWEGQFGIHRAASTAKWLALTGGDAGLMAQYMGTSWSINSCCNLFLNPISGAVSDSYKRGPVIAFTRLGLCAYFLGQWVARRPIHMVLADTLGWGILSAGGLAVQSAALDDMFGDRPELNSAIASANASMAGLSGCLGPLVGILCWHRGWSNAAFLLPAVMLAVQAGLFFTCPETLRPENRVPFKPADVLTSANPISNLGLLLTNGPGLRRLSLASLFYHSCTSTWSSLEAYRNDARAIGWSPDFASGFDSFFFLSTAFSTAVVVPRLIARWGNRKLFEIWSNVAGLAFMGVGQAWRGTSFVRRSAQYIAPAIVLQDPWTDPCVFALRAMVIDKGMSDVRSVGQGQLSAAYDGLTDIVGVIMPATWGYLFSKFASAQGGILGWIGIGGHWMIAGCFRIIAGLLVRSLSRSGADGDGPAAAAAAGKDPQEQERRATI